MRSKLIDLLLATTNLGKVREIHRYLAGLPLNIQPLTQLGAVKPYPEKGKTFLENARGKSLYYSRKSTELTLAEDSGLEIAALKGSPGVLSARFSGPGATDQSNIEKVLCLLEGVPDELRTARFVSVMVLARKGKVIKEIQGTVEGRIAHSEQGKQGFGYDPIFTYPPLGRTFAQLAPEEKNRISHRGRALRSLKDFLVQYLNPA